MSTRTNVASAANVKQQTTIAIGGTWAGADTITLTIDNVDFTITVGGVTTTTGIAITLKEAFNSSSASALTDTTATMSPAAGAQAIGQYANIIASIVTAGTVIFTARNANQPFTMTVAKSSTSGTVSLTNAIAATGQSNFGNQDNWSANTVPVDGDDIVFDSGNIDILDGLSPAIQPGTFTKTKSFTGRIGRAEVNKENSTLSYGEYRTKALTFDDNTATGTYNLETGDGQGSSRVRIDAGAGQSVFNVFGQGRRELAGVPSILLAGTHSSNILNNLAGDVGFAFYASESGTLATLNSGTEQGNSAKTVIGAGATLSSCTVSMLGGTLETNSAVSSVTQAGGTWTHYAGTITAAVLNGGTFVSKFAGTITDLTIRGATWDKRQDGQAVTCTNLVQLYKGAKIYDPNGTITFSAGIKLNCKLSEVTLDLGQGRTITPS